MRKGRSKPRNRGLKPTVILTPELGFPVLVSSSVTRQADGSLVEGFRRELLIDFLPTPAERTGVLRFKLTAQPEPETDWIHRVVRDEFLKQGAI